MYLCFHMEMFWNLWTWKPNLQNMWLDAAKDWLHSLSTRRRTIMHMQIEPTIQLSLLSLILLIRNCILFKVTLHCKQSELIFFCLQEELICTMKILHSIEKEPEWLRLVLFQTASWLYGIRRLRQFCWRLLWVCRLLLQVSSLCRSIHLDPIRSVSLATVKLPSISSRIILRTSLQGNFHL